MLGNKIVSSEKIYKFAFDYFFIGVISFLLFIKNVFLKLKNSIFLPKYMRYGKNVENEICLFQKHLQIKLGLFFHKNYTFSFIYLKCVCENQKFKFPAKIYGIRIKCQGTKMFISKRSTTLVHTIFS